MRRARITLLAVAAVTCTTALLTPAASASKPPPLTITGLSVTGTGPYGSPAQCLFDYTVTFAGHMHHGDYVKLSAGQGPPSEISLGHEKSPFTETHASLLKADVTGTSGTMSLTISILAKDNTTVLASATTAPIALTTSCPTGTYSPPS